MEESMKKWNLVVGNKAKAKVLSVLLAVTMSFSLFGCGQTASDKSNEEASAAASEVEAEADAAASEAKATPSHSSESGKDETVYIVTDASGNPTNITVNDQLKNKDGAATLVDKTDLKDIVNVNGDGSYTENSDGTITWETESADVYYQGTTDKTLPVTVSLSYQLDGKDIRPEDLAGKSGHVKIRFDYKNTATVKEKVGGKEEDVTVPFAMISGAILPMDKFTNVSVTNGKIMGDGQNNIVVGMAFPGLKDALDWENLKKDAKDDDAKKKLDDIDIPEYVEIEADVKDFALDMTMTMASSNILSDLGDVDDIDVSSVTDKMNDLQDGTDKLEDGAKQLKDGTSDLKDGVSKLADGTSDMKDGTSDLRDGASKLKDGTSDLKDGASDLKDGTSDLKDGAATLKSGTSELKNGASDLKSGTSKLKDGTSDLKSGMQKLADGATTLKNGSSTLATGTDSLKAGTGQLKSGAEKVSGGASSLAGGLAQLQTATSGLTKEKADAVKNGLSSLVGGLYELQAAVQVAAGSVSDGGENDGTKSVTLISGMKAIQKQTEANKSTASAAYQEQQKVTKYLIDKLSDKNNGINTLKNLLVIRDSLKAKEEEIEKEISAIGAITQDDVTKAGAALSAATEKYQTAAETYAKKYAQYAAQQALSNSGESANADNNSASANTQSDTSVAETSEEANEEANEEATMDADTALQSGNTESAGEDEEASQGDIETSDDKNSEIVTEDDTTGTNDQNQTVNEDIYIETVTGTESPDIDYQSDYEKAKSEMDEAEQNMAYAQNTYTNLSKGLTELTALNAEYDLCKQQISKINNTIQSSGFTEDEINKGTSDKDTLAAYKSANSVSESLATIQESEQALSTAESAEISSMDKLYLTLNKAANSVDDQMKDASPVLQSAEGLINSLPVLSSKIQQAADGASDLCAGAQSLASGAASADAGAAKLQAGAKELDTGAGTLKSGIDSANSGTGSLYDGATSLDDGAGKLYSGTVSVDDGAGSLYNGTVKLDDGAGTLYDGTVDLDNGAGDLYDGVVKLDDGAQDLCDGAKQLLDGSGDLDDGTQDLLDGIIKLNDEGIRKLTELFGDNVQDAVDRIKAVKNASIDYQTFTEVAPSEDKDAVNTVKFVYRTAAVKSE